VSEEARYSVVGFVALLALLVLGVLSFTTTTTEKTAGFDITADFDRADGLTVGDEVLMSGIKIGEVTRMNLTESFRARLTLNIDDGVELPSDSDARILTNGLFGSKFIEVNPGAEEEILEAGGEIEFTQESIILQDLLDQVIGQGRSARAERAGK